MTNMSRTIGFRWRRIYIAANGYIEPSRIFLQGSIEDVRQAVRQCAFVSKETTSISAGCAVKRDSPPEN